MNNYVRSTVVIALASLAIGCQEKDEGPSTPAPTTAVQAPVATPAPAAAPATAPLPTTAETLDPYCLREERDIQATAAVNWQTCEKIALFGVVVDENVVCKEQALADNDTIEIKRAADGKMTLSLDRVNGNDVTDVELTAQAVNTGVVVYSKLGHDGSDFYLYRTGGASSRDWRIELFASDEAGVECNNHRPVVGTNVKPGACQNPTGQQGATGGGGGNLIVLSETGACP